VIGNNSCGAYSVAYGTPRDQLISCQLVLSDASVVELNKTSQAGYVVKASQSNLEGNIYRKINKLLVIHADAIRSAFPDTSLVRRNTGYALDHLLDQPRWSASGTGEANLAGLVCGSEGTLGIVTRATFQLQPLPVARGLLVVHYHDVFAALDATPVLLATGAVAVELIDAPTLAGSKGHTGLDQYRFWLVGEPEAVQVVEYFADSVAELNDALDCAQRQIAADGRHYAIVPVMGSDMQAVWQLRKAGLGLLMGKVAAKKAVAVIEDAAIPIVQLSAFMRDIRQLMTRLSVNCIYYGHASVGLIHLRPELDLTDAADKAKFVDIAQAVSRLVKNYRGALSGEHGDGRLRAPFLPEQFGAQVYAILCEVKQLFDPQGILNPGKIIGLTPIDQQWRRSVAAVHLAEGMDWQAERGFAASVEKCNGAGACRQSVGAMCPSFHITRDDAHSTRGRANLLRFALQSADPRRALAADDLQAALSTCLSCKACKSECPASVDMSRLKSEVAYQTRDLQPKSWRQWVFRYYAALLPWLNWFRMGVRWLNAHPSWLKHLPLLSGRKIPQASTADLMLWWQAQGASANPAQGQRVLVWVDVFSRYLHVDQGKAVIQVLQRLGFVVQPIWLQDSPRMLISHGYFEAARNCLQDALAQLPSAHACWGLVGIEPAELLVLRDDGQALLSAQERQPLSQWLDRIWLFDEAMLVYQQQFPNTRWSQLNKKIALHVHCHQKSLAGVSAAQSALSLLSDEVHLLSVGCCGMAGSFGYQQPVLSRQIADHGILQALLDFEKEHTLLCANGSSCQQQLVDFSDWSSWHSAQLFWQALESRT
jgi:FAD/FMN-containing dehydrogenase/Fe-S oxidoreductase